ncbi:hypothetical protein M0805_006376 [Coniferiporia weirii]|nr:hypothetical protein M0805_006376 [Coniferiporia weirii]
MDDVQVAVAILADASTTLASRWRAVLLEYVTPLLSRLIDGRPGVKLNISFVTYAAADYRPTPIVAKRYFNNPQHTLKEELRDDPSRLGIGRTGSNAKLGMAALEGYAAALEMFDLFLKPQPPKKEATSDKALDIHSLPICHIIHISATQIDKAHFPMWNQTTSLDNLSWKSLPEELRKRNINLSLIILGHNSKLCELHTSATSEPCPAWFTVQTGHQVLLSSQSSWASASTKRANESENLDKAGEAKRARVSTPLQNPSTSSQPDSSQTTFPNTLAGGPAPSLPPVQPSAAVTLSTPNTLADFMQKFRIIEGQLRANQAQYETLRQQGRLQEADNIKKATAPKLAMYNKLRPMLLQAMQQGNIPQGSGASSKPADAKPVESVPVRPPPTSVVSSQPQPTTTGFSIDPSSQLSQPTATQSVQQLSQAHGQNQQFNTGFASNTESGGLLPGSLPQFSPSVAAQMQKLKMREGIKGQTSLSLTQSQAQQQQYAQMGLASGSAPSSSNPPQFPPSAGQNRWVGDLTWRDPQSLGLMETHVQVLSKANIRPELWPLKLELNLSTEHAVPLPVFKEWMGRYGPAACHIKPLSRTIDGQENGHHFKKLATLLYERNVYAIGSWSLPSTGLVKPTILVFSFGAELVAAAFPETGVPVFPRANPQVSTGPQMNVAGPPGNVPPNIIAALQNMTAEERLKYMYHIRQYQMHAQGAGSSSNAVNMNMLGNAAGGIWPRMQGVGNMNTQLPFDSNQQAQLAATLGLAGGAGQGMQNFPGLPAGMNIGQALAAMQQQRQNNLSGMPGPPDSGGPTF